MPPNKISAERSQHLQKLIGFAEACSKPWLCVDVVSALKELESLRALTTLLVDAVDDTLNTHIETDCCVVTRQRLKAVKLFLALEKISLRSNDDEVTS